MKVLIGLLVILLLSGCARVSLHRDENGVLDVEYSSFFKEMVAPALEVEKEGDYSASFNAEKTGDSANVAQALGSVERIIMLGVGAKVVQQPDNE